MNRPLVLQERLQVETENLEEPSAAVRQLIACFCFLAGQVIGGYPTGKMHLLLRHQAMADTLALELTMTVPLSEVQPDAEK